MKKYMIVAFAAACFSGQIMAHHGHTSQFDPSRIVEVAGDVTDIGWVNPHAYVYLDVTNEDGSITNWHCEMRASSVLNRSGWKKEMFETGTPIEIVGVMSRKEDNGCYVETIAFNGLEPIERYATDIPESAWKPTDTTEVVEETINLIRPQITAWGAPYIGGDWAAPQRLVGAISNIGGADAGTAAGGPPTGMAGPGGDNEAAAAPPRRRGAQIQLTPAGEAASAALTAAAAADDAAGRLDCQPRDFFNDWTFDQPSNRIIQTEDTITLMYGFMDTIRTVHMNIDAHPENLIPSWAGHSIGRWEGDVLVVDTVGFTVGSSRRYIRSEEFHTVERFTLDYQAGSLTRSYKADDSLFWAEDQEFTGEDVVFYADYPFEPYNCDDRTVE